MAEYLGVPVSTENDPEDTPSFHAVCKLWVKSDSWPIEDAVRLLLNHLPKVFIKGAEKENVHKSFNIILELANNCLGHSLDLVKNYPHDTIARVDPFDFVKWAKGKDIPVPAELDLALDLHQKIRKEKKSRFFIEKQTNHRERVRAIGSLLWTRNPNIEFSDMINRPEILEHGCEGQYYAEAVIVSWLQDLDPNS